METERWRGEAELAQRGLKKLKEQFEELLWKQLPLDSDQEKKALMRYKRLSGKGFLSHIWLTNRGGVSLL